jgi:hypothetical protein
MSRCIARRRARHFIRAVPAVLLAVGLTAGSAYTTVLDLGATETVVVPFTLDPATQLRIPPAAFGPYPPGTYAEIGIDAPSCNGPNCINGQGILVAFDGRFTGDLVLPIAVQVHYDEAAVRRFGAAEEDLTLARYVEAAQEWQPYAGQTIDTASNLVLAAETENIRIFIAVFAGAPQVVAPATWGAVKALFQPPAP